MNAVTTNGSLLPRAQVLDRALATLFSSRPGASKTPSRPRCRFTEKATPASLSHHPPPPAPPPPPPPAHSPIPSARSYTTAAVDAAFADQRGDGDFVQRLPKGFVQ